MSDIILHTNFHNDAERSLSAPSFKRQAWLECAVAALRAKFAELGYAIPYQTRVSIGWPKRAASCGAVGSAGRPRRPATSITKCSFHRS
jgi:hypothetical protein